MLRITPVSKDNDVRIRVVGDIDPKIIEDFRRCLFDLVPDAARVVTIDASQLGCAYSDSLAVLVELAVALRWTGGELRILRPAPRLRHLLALTRLDRVISIVDE